MENNEKWREVFTESQLKRLQQLEFIELQVVKKICKQLDIDFFLYGGTLLGAFKYKGFIPWDDDVDIAMTRNHYEIFIKEAPKILPKDFVLQNIWIDKRTPYSYTKLRLKGTICIEQYNDELNIEKGVYIDIYPVDNIPDDNKLYQEQFEEVQRLLSIIYNRQCFHTAFKDVSMIKFLKRKVYYYCLRFLSIDNLYAKLNKAMNMYNGHKCQRKSCLYYPKIENYYNQLYPLVSIIFEGEEFYAPNDMVEHLKRRYGNINELPPSDKRIGHYVYELNFGVFENKDPQW